ncbi:hypothetical protein A0O36_00597 [Piscirickettsiaceae bacterium NZ-RLO1]|nr:hypothetical protein A0O36_00597 [Piscirickettsiaceae bacterium NZ-RLO1]
MIDRYYSWLGSVIDVKMEEVITYFVLMTLFG